MYILMDTGLCGRGVEMRDPLWTQEFLFNFHEALHEKKIPIPVVKSTYKWVRTLSKQTISNFRKQPVEELNKNRCY